jgi:NAD+ kinase
MSLPIDLILVRHGQSEGNVAARLAEEGNHDGYKAIKQGRHSRSYRLSSKGREQAKIAGLWLQKEFTKDGKTFDRFVVSEYTRAMETAALLGLPDAVWYRSFYLTEREWGDLENITEQEREEKFKDALEMRAIEPFFWQPPNGESFAELCLRLDRVLNTLHRECGNMRVIIVCHGEVMRAFRVLLERMPQQRFKEIYESKAKEDGIHNCEVFHYSRRNPKTQEIEEHANWFRRVRPTDEPIWETGWQEIIRPKYTNDALLEIVEQTPSMIE